MKHLKTIISVLFFLCGSTGCNDLVQKESTLFTLLSVEESGVSFVNRLTESDTLNYFNYPYLYMGGGVSVLDVNNDGLSDLFFTGNMVADALYLNKGDMKFKDISNSAEINKNGSWHTGSTIVDINQDGWTDIYVSVSGKSGDLKNLLYVNNQNNTFTERAEEYGIADTGNSTQSTFFDYDLDGDLDLFVANYPPAPFNSSNFYYKKRMRNPKLAQSDRLYRNEGLKFSDATVESGILNYGLSLSATVGDLNDDGWPDIYVSNDFASPDHLYLNNQNGTFREVISESTGHTSYYGMGTDVADFNNDGRPDIIQADMTPEENLRSKANMATMDINRFTNMIDIGIHYQYMQNVLQLNQGVNDQGIPLFSDVSRISGLATTDWSWATLFMDADNDGYKDIFISNGTRRDINNKDYFKKLKDRVMFTQNKDLAIKAKEIPSTKTANYIFKNNGNLNFSDQTKDWGMDHLSFSNGAAYADLNNDGYLDLIINNVDEPVSIYQNNKGGIVKNRYLRFKMKGRNSNPQGFGVEVHIEHKNMKQWQYLTATRGFQSSMEPILHFGVGDEKVIERVLVQWPDGKQQELTQVQSNQQYLLDYHEAGDPTTTRDHDIQLFQEFTAASNISFSHTENEYNDFEKEVLLPHKMSQFGPGLAVGDANGDGREDFFIGNAAGQTGALFIQNPDGGFVELNGPWQDDAGFEDIDAAFVDIDGDGDQDLYLVSGGNEFEKGSPMLQDRLYSNLGNGRFEKAVNSLPEMTASGACVRPCDFDRDGDMDLFIGGRLVPGHYPLPPKSYLLRNDGGKDFNLRFSNVTNELAPVLANLGMVTDAIWSDFNNDNKMDLVVVGEWMPLTFLEHTAEGFINKTAAFDMKATTGWWFSLASKDIDNDGDEDYVAGNLGLNYKYKATVDQPFNIYSDDFDGNGQLDIVLGYHQGGVEYPVRGRECSTEQMPDLKYKFKDYTSFASASLADVYGEQNITNALVYQAKNFATSYIENLGDGKFNVVPLSNKAQLSSVNGIIIEDLDKDGHEDVLIAGNLYSSEVETPRNDAGMGLFLKGNGKGNFEAVDPAQSGLLTRSDVKSIRLLNQKDKKLLLLAANNDSLRLISIK